MEVRGQIYAPGTFIWREREREREIMLAMHYRLDGPQNQSGHFKEKYPVPAGNQIMIPQLPNPWSGHCIDYNMPANITYKTK
jgi:hypothetical protein